MQVAVYCSSSNQVAEVYRQAAKDLGKLIASRGHTLIYGGNACGLMGDVSTAAAQAGGKVIGVNLERWREGDLPNADNTETVYFTHLAERKTYMATQAQCYIALAGGLGTLDEAADIMARIQLEEIQGQMLFLNTNGYYDGLKLQFERFAAEHCLTENSTNAFRFVQNVQELATLL